MDQDLADLAAAHGVSTGYHAGWHWVEADESVVRGVLSALGVDAGSPESVRVELAAAREIDRRPTTIVLRDGDVHELDGPGEVRCEDGTVVAVNDGRLTGLPLGWHRLAVDDRELTVVVVPRRLPKPPRAWGWQVQLYGLRSAGSWGIGDFADLRTFADWSGTELGAGVVVVNPMHAPVWTTPVDPSPYAPSSRRFVNPWYLRIEDTEAFRHADPDTRARVSALRPNDGGGEYLDYDTMWAAKQQALELLHASVGSRTKPTPNTPLADFAVYCALAEKHGSDWRQWPQPLRHPRSVAVERAAAEFADRVALHTWVQGLCARQLDAAQFAAKNAGMSIGIVHDLAVGVVGHGADSWALQDVLADGATIGAPPDAFTQHGQDWQLAPWHPRRLAEAGYQPYRELVGSVLRHAGGVRVDHAPGLWRLWLVPPGESPDRGAYVHYDSNALLGILALEASRAGAVVIGEDLGTVPPECTDGLTQHNMLGSAVMWFQRNDDLVWNGLRAPQNWPPMAAASISTHDLPTAAGFLRSEPTRVRNELGLLTESIDAAWHRAHEDRLQVINSLKAAGVLHGDDPWEGDIILALHRFLARTASRLHLVSPYDVLGEHRQPNLPGTTKEYPNWRLPLPMLLEQLRNDPRIHALRDIFNSGEL
jgi:4-alpha-glucanotransferase